MQMNRVGKDIGVDESEALGKAVFQGRYFGRIMTLRYQCTIQGC
jgi:hypothetical protein